MKMNQDVLISIIIPVYKAEKYIVQCIESILVQTYKNFELILIDDGSPDRSGIICDEYAEKDTRIRVLHQKNAGPSCCRNRGIELAKGKYLCFVDSDDWVDVDYLASMVEEMTENVDLVVGGFILEGKERKILKKEHQIFTLKDKDNFHDLVVKRLLFGPCQKMYSLSIVKKYHLLFPEGIHYGEDRLFNYAYLHHVNYIASIAHAAYHYRIHENDSLSSNVYPNMFELEYTQWKALYRLYEYHDLFSEVNLRYHWREFYWLVIDNILNVNQWNYRKTWKEKYEYIQNILKVPEVKEVKKYKHWLKDASSMQFYALTKGIVFYFYLIQILKR